ncbi:hypothetical protein GX48_07622 [Paracoccidioides brasiliensis]|nr:hypothetical protein GX48_07622 [Paracoccidioides brasiliensis]
MCRIRRWINIVIFFDSGRRGELRRSQDPRAVGDGEIGDLAFRSDYISVIDDMENGRGRETSRLSDQISEVQFLGQISIVQKFLLHNDQQQASEIAIGCLRIATSGNRKGARSRGCRQKPPRINACNADLRKRVHRRIGYRSEDWETWKQRLQSSRR